MELHKDSSFSLESDTSSVGPQVNILQQTTTKIDQLL